MTVVCAWCNKIIKKGISNERVSHGICLHCYQKIRQEYIEPLRQEVDHA